MSRLRLFFTCLALIPAGAWAQLNYAGGLLTQNFDSLPSANSFDYSDVGIAKGPAQLTAAPVLAPAAAGWSIHARVGTQLLFLVGNGNVGTAGAYSYGHHAASDRALGSLGGSGHAANLGWRLVNTTGQTLTSFTISFYAEQWRNGGTASLTGLTGEFRLTSSGDIDSGTYTAVTDMNAPAVLAVTTGGFELNGNTSGNRVERSATVTGLNWTAGQMLILRWRDLDETGADNAIALDDVLFHAPTSTSTAPQVQMVQPAAGAANVFGTSPVVITFDQPVNVSGTWFELTGSISGPLSATVSNAGPMRYTLTPSTAWPVGENITVRVIAPQVTNLGSQIMNADHSIVFSTLVAPTSVLPISTVQSAEGYSPMTGAVVTIQGIVTADHQGPSPALGGFSVQEEASDMDSDPLTSEAVWIRDTTNAVPVSVGDVVQVTGTVSESGSLTQLTNVTAVTITGTASLPEVTAVTLPTATTTGLERFESMTTIFSQPLYVTSNSGGTGVTDGFSRFGELTLCSDGPLVNPTEIIDPNDVPASGTSSTGKTNAAAIHAHERDMARQTLLLDDASAAQYPDPMPYLNAEGTRRCGDTVTGLTGILTYSSGVYRIHPTAAVNFIDSNPRQLTPPAISGRLKIAAMNVLNYFTTFGGANDRGASNAAEFQRQKDKVISALVGLNADVIGLMEIQNSPAAVSDLLTTLNAAVTDDYAVVPDPVGGYPLAGTGADYIRCLLLYRPSKCSLYAACHMDTDAAWTTPGSMNPLRFPLAQVFEENSTGERCIVCVNHWKSKSSSGATGLNTDQNDGQAAFNDLRKQQANRLHLWLQSVAATVGDNDMVIIGDLNSNGEEDPLDILRANGWADQGQRFHGSTDYSYRLSGMRGRLDHAFATSTMASQVPGFDHWHINADEPAFYDYNMESKTAAQLLINVGTPFRSSDHDPLLIGVNLSPQPTTYAMWQAARTWTGGSSQIPTDDPDGDGLANLIEFALNTDPESANAAQMPQGTVSGADFHFDFRSRVQLAGASIIPEWSEDLSQWFPILTVTTLGSIDLRTEQKRATLSTSGKSRLFTRLRVTGP